jgi:hypothetical protein
MPIIQCPPDDTTGGCLSAWRIGNHTELTHRTPPQTLNVTIDTGSTTLWVYDTCSADACVDAKTFRAGKSSTFWTDHESFTQKYGVGGVSGTVGTDVVRVAGNAVSGQQFGES